MQIHTLTQSHLAYPQSCTEFADAPQTLYAQGNLALLNSPCVTIIGTRQPTTIGFRTAYKLGYEFARAGITVVSGLAFGCDTFAHRGALDANGATLAVLGTTLEQEDMYPKSNRGLAQRILANRGLLITEYNQKKYDKGRFIERDRIQAQLCQLILPVQGDVTSGTRHACEYGLDHHITLCIPLPDSNDELLNPKQYGLIHELVSMRDTLKMSVPEDIPGIIDLVKQTYTHMFQAA